MEDLDLHTIDNWRKWLRGVSAHYGFETWDSGPWVFFRKGKEIPPCEELQRVWDESDGKQVHPFCAKCYKIFLQPKLEPTLEKFVKTVYSTLSTLSDRNVIGKIRIPYTPDFYKDPSSEKLVVYSYGRKEMWENIRKLYGNMDSQELGSDVPAPYAKAIYNRYTGQINPLISYRQACAQYRKEKGNKKLIASIAIALSISLGIGLFPILSNYSGAFNLVDRNISVFSLIASLLSIVIGFSVYAKLHK